MKVRFAVSVGHGWPDGDLLRRVVTEAEDRGFDTLYFADLPSLPSTDPLLAVALAAGVTRRMKLGANFIPFGYQPFLFAHKLAHLDRLTAGRLLITLVPGLDLPGERQALGTEGRHRGRLMDDLLPQLRDWWAGGGNPALAVTPVQDPLEVWLGGSGPEAIKRAGRLSDGWLGSLTTPDRAGEIREAIQAEAAAAGRTIDPEHFGLSIGYARRPEDIHRAVRLRRPRPNEPTDLTELIPVGAGALTDLVGRLVDRGLSKFVVRPVAPVEDWSDELGWLASTVLDLQT